MPYFSKHFVLKNMVYCNILISIYLTGAQDSAACVSDMTCTVVRPLGIIAITIIVTVMQI